MKKRSRLIHFAPVASVFTTVPFLIGLLLQAPSIGHAADTQPVPDRIVYPTGVFPDDVRNVQNAVNPGGTVLLKATSTSGQLTAFNFGPTGPTSAVPRQVYLFSHDVIILGETVDGQMTTIRGGYHPFRLISPIGITPIQSAIRGIHFDSPRSAAVLVVGSGGCEVSGCWIHDVVGHLSFGPTGPTKGQGVWLISDTVTGKVTLANNLVQNVHSQIGYGFVLLFFAAEAEITGNVVTGVNSTGIWVGITPKPGRIEGNVVEAGPETDPNGSFGEGIAMASVGNFYCANNSVSCVNPLADGIYFQGEVDFGGLASDSVIEKNDVNMQDSLFGGITLFDLVNDCVIQENNVSGNGAFALGVTTYFEPNDVGSDNLFVGNNISHFQSSLADSFFDVNSRNNVLKGNSGTVVDLGSGNQINGFTVKGMSDQQRQAHQASMQAKAQRRANLLTAEANAQTLDNSE